MPDTTLRYLETLRAIPRQPRKITVDEVHRRLEAAGYAIHRRSVERDLQRLSSVFPLACDEGVRPTGWYWLRDAADLVAPGMDSSEALEIELLARYLRPLLPATSWRALQPRLIAARAALATTASTALRRWRSRVAVLDDGQPLAVPDVASEVLDVVHESLMHNRRFRVDYRAIAAEQARSFEVNPIALVYVGQVGYLVATLWGYADLRHLALHRMSSPEALTSRARQPADFDLDAYLRGQAAFDFPTEEELRLRLRVSPWLARHLEERQLSPEQRISADPEQADRFIVEAAVAGSERLVWWLRSHGDALEVLRPVTLRRRLAGEYRELARTYRR